ncbi:MAG: DNA repair protein RecO [Patescibacteria group bacterium]
MERINKTQGIVLGKREWGEQDLLFFVYTEKFGKVEAVVKAAKKIKSKLNGHLPIMGLSEILFIEGRTKMKIISAHLLNNFKLASEEDFYFFSALAEVMIKSTVSGERHEQIWKTLIWARSMISRSNNSDEKKLALNMFLIKLATISGYKISVEKKMNLDKEIQCLIEQVQGSEVGQIKVTAKNNGRLFSFLREYYLNILERPLLSFDFI